MSRSIIKGLAVTFGLIGLIFLFGLVLIKSNTNQPPIIIPNPTSTSKSFNPELEKSQSDQDFKDYISKSQQNSSNYSKGVIQNSITAPALGGASKIAAESAPTPDRVSQTNVQVKGIDEPDIIKSDGKELYFSPTSVDYFVSEPIIQPLMDEKSEQEVPRSDIMPIPPAYKNPGVKAVRAFPPQNLKLDSQIDKNGDLLLVNNNLVIFSQNKVYGYDVSNPNSPKEKWSIELKNNSHINTSRLYKNNIYLVSSFSIYDQTPCPIEILSLGQTSYPLKCTDIYHPRSNSPVDTVYTISIINPQSGEIKDSLSFVGSTSNSVIYMSTNSIYVSFYYPGSNFDILYGFLSENGDLIPQSLLAKLNKLVSYDISDSSKETEATNTLQKYLTTLTEDEKLKFQNDLQNRMDKYLKVHKRDLEQTGIVKIDVGDLKISSVGTIPGHPLNQFAMDEFEDNLRVATTIGENWWGFGFVNRQVETANDVYVLNRDLKIIGSIKDLGLKERIYSARFIENKGYVVTFRQTDPFYVIDLSNPNKPILAGELKIPGFSSYLHPITQDSIVGVGMENQKVKLSLFDVKDSENPLEIDKYNMEEYWTEVSNNHHAFLMDKKHKVFFLPGSNGGYVFSYEGNKLNLVKALSGMQVKRAIYIDNYLYIISEGKITILDESSWSKVNEIAI